MPAFRRRVYFSPDMPLCALMPRHMPLRCCARHAAYAHLLRHFRCRAAIFFSMLLRLRLLITDAATLYFRHADADDTLMPFDARRYFPSFYFRY